MNDELHIMVDIETLGTRPGAAILSIGAVVFAPYDDLVPLRDTFLVHIDLASALASGSVDAATLRWWLLQDAAARAEAFSGEVDVDTALRRLNQWWPLPMAGHLPPVWANDPAFDLVLLEQAYARRGYDAPWTYREHRSCRTLKALTPDAAVPQRDGGEHQALADAQYQATCVSARLRWLRHRTAPAAIAGPGDLATGD